MLVSTVFERHLFFWFIELFEGCLSSCFRLLSYDVVMLRFGLLDVHIDCITDLACPLFHVERFCDVDNS